MNKIMSKIKNVCLGLVIFGMSGVVLADGISGHIGFQDGSNCSSCKVSTSWNGKTTFTDSRGNFSLDMGNVGGSKATIYVAGTKVCRTSIKGTVRVNATVKGSLTGGLYLVSGSCS